MNILAILLSTLLTVNTHTSQIIRNSPNININKAREIALITNTYAELYQVPTKIILSLMFVESSYRLHIVNKRSNDYGILQVNNYNIKAYKLNKKKLTTDLEYSISSGIMVFSWFFKTYPLDEAIKRFHCGTAPKCTKYQRTRRYLKKVYNHL